MDQAETLKVNATISELVNQRDMALNGCVEMRIQIVTDAAASAEKIATTTRQDRRSPVLVE